MRLRTVSKGTRIVVLTLASLLLVGLFALPSSAAAGDRNEFIHTFQYFEDYTLTCATGSFQASGVFATSGNARSCARQFSSPSVVQGVTQLHNGDDLTVNWKMQCKATSGDRPRHFDCLGQWSVDGPNWTGHGNTRAVLDFYAAPYGTVEFTFNGNLTAV